MLHNLLYLELMKQLINFQRPRKQHFIMLRFLFLDFVLVVENSIILFKRFREFLNIKKFLNA
jgi:hypothetical protein